MGRDVDHCKVEAWVEMWITERWEHRWRCGSLKGGGMGGDVDH